MSAKVLGNSIRAAAFAAAVAVSLSVVSGASGIQDQSKAFVKAADMSQLPDFDCYGQCNRFKPTPSSQPVDALVQLKAAGLTHIRSRLWNDPLPANSYANLTGVLGLASRADMAGLSLWLDLHYSDWWADPGQQNKPAAWADMDLSQLEAAVQQFTHDTVAALVAQGTPPLIVQVGNEIQNGFLWPGPGQSCADSGALYKSGCASEGPDGNWPAFATLIAAGIAGVRSAYPAAMIMIHTALGPNLSMKGGPEYIAEWYANVTRFGTGDWDAVGLSCYPHWGFGNTSNFELISGLLALLPAGKSVFVAETAFPYAGSQPGAQFPITPAGQLSFVRSALADAALGSAAGVAYWGTEYTQGSGAGMTALWDEQCVALPALTNGWQ